MLRISALLSFLSIFSIFFSSIAYADPWPGPGTGPQDLKAFPSKIDCRLEIVFTTDDTNYNYTVYGLFENSDGPIKLKPFEVQDGSTWPITVVNGDSSDDPGAYSELASNVRYVVLIVDVCATDHIHGKFQNITFIRGNPGGLGGVDVWESDHILVTEEYIPSPGVLLLEASGEKNLILNPKPNEDLSYTANLKWKVDSAIDTNEILGFWTFVGYRGKGKHFIQSLYFPLKHQYGGPENGIGYVNFKIPSNFDFKHDDQFIASISVQTKKGAFSDPVTCPQLNFKIPK